MTRLLQLTINFLKSHRQPKCGLQLAREGHLPFASADPHIPVFGQQHPKCDRSICQMKHQLDATLCRFYFCRVTLHVSGASAHHKEYLKLVQWPLVHVLSLQVSHHISILGPELPELRSGSSGPNKEM